MDDVISWGGKLVAAGSAKLVAAVATYPARSGTDAAASGADRPSRLRESPAEVYRPSAVFQGRLEGRRHGRYELILRLCGTTA
ncbi:mitochondrial carrier protein RIM2 [Trichophyton equinum CBS 127.97]|uniref:Mitochondrial carrier protein RIM2 n=1 Tax=Trichophyton equinum (strain ATCC MYA-4606 / CBS 127.97) TaxID=559882 RepID=F2PVB7_TRIEC|nr:mitochondrial carrier protein RIM2 [Trichophyton equinum CBS 127.97]